MYSFERRYGGIFCSAASAGAEAEAFLVFVSLEPVTRTQRRRRENGKRRKELCCFSRRVSRKGGNCAVACWGKEVHTSRWCASSSVGERKALRAAGEEGTWRENKDCCCSRDAVFLVTCPLGVAEGMHVVVKCLYLSEKTIQRVENGIAAAEEEVRSSREEASSFIVKVQDNTPPSCFAVPKRSEMEDSNQWSRHGRRRERV